MNEKTYSPWQEVMISIFQGAIREVKALPNCFEPEDINDYNQRLLYPLIFLLLDHIPDKEKMWSFYQEIKEKVDKKLNGDYISNVQKGEK